MSTTITPNSTINTDPSIIGHSSNLKEKRPRVSAKKRKKAQGLEQDLLLLLDKHMDVPEFAKILQTAINSAHALAESTRNTDRDAVLLVLDGWVTLTLEEICEDTGLSAWVARGILEEFISLSLVEVSTQYDPAPTQGSSPQLFGLIHSPATK